MSLDDALRRLGAGLPRPLVEAARTARTAALRAAGPFDALARRLAGRGGLPPLWLRRHAGRIADFERPNPAWLHLLDEERALGRGGLVLDVGCGPGSLALALAPRLGPGGRYAGFDVHEPSIRWCRGRFAADPRFRFELAELASPFSAGAGTPVTEYRFPAADGEATLVLARSVFTHLLEREAAHYLAETRRVLRRDGLAVISALLFTGGGTPAEVPAFPYPDAASPVRWRVATRPEAGVAYGEERFRALLAASGLSLVRLAAGFYPGHAATLTGQDLLVLAPATRGSASG